MSDRKKLPDNFGQKEPVPVSALGGLELHQGSQHRTEPPEPEHQQYFKFPIFNKMQSRVFKAVGQA